MNPQVHLMMTLVFVIGAGAQNLSVCDRRLPANANIIVLVDVSTKFSPSVFEAFKAKLWQYLSTTTNNTSNMTLVRFSEGSENVLNWTSVQSENIKSIYDDNLTQTPVPADTDIAVPGILESLVEAKQNADELQNKSQLIVLIVTDAAFSDEVITNASDVASSITRNLYAAGVGEAYDDDKMAQLVQESIEAKDCRIWTDWLPTRSSSSGLNAAAYFGFLVAFVLVNLLLLIVFMMACICAHKVKPGQPLLPRNADGTHGERPRPSPAANNNHYTESNDLSPKSHNNRAELTPSVDRMRPENLAHAPSSENAFSLSGTLPDRPLPDIPTGAPDPNRPLPFIPRTGPLPLPPNATGQGVSAERKPKHSKLPSPFKQISGLHKDRTNDDSRALKVIKNTPVPTPSITRTMETKLSQSPNANVHSKTSEESLYLAQAVSPPIKTVKQSELSWNREVKENLSSVPAGAMGGQDLDGQNLETCRHNPTTYRNVKTAPHLSNSETFAIPLPEDEIRNDRSFSSSKRHRVTIDCEPLDLAMKLKLALAERNLCKQGVTTATTNDDIDKGDEDEDNECEKYVTFPSINDDIHPSSSNNNEPMDEPQEDYVNLNYFDIFKSDFVSQMQKVKRWSNRMSQVVRNSFTGVKLPASSLQMTVPPATGANAKSKPEYQNKAMWNMDDDDVY